MEPPTSVETQKSTPPSSSDVTPPVVLAPRHSSSVLTKFLLYGICLMGALAALFQLYPLIPLNQAHKVTIVFSAPLSLDSTTISLNSITLALEEHGYKAGAVDLSLKVLDDGDETGNWNSEKELANATYAVEDESVMAYLGPLNSGAAKVSMPILNKANIVQISPSNTWPGLTKIGFFPGEPGNFYPTGIRHYFRVCTTDDRQGPAGARWADELGFKNIYIVNDYDAYGVGIANLFENEVNKRGMNVVGTSGVSPAADSYTSVADAIMSTEADLVYYGGITPNGGPELLAELRRRGSSVAFMGPDGIFEQDFLDRSEGAAEGMYVTAVGAPPEEVATPGAAAFVAAYKARFNSDPDVFGALAYDATIALIDSIERAPTIDRQSILSEVRDIKNHAGVFGVWGFDTNGDTTQTLMSGNRVSGGKFTFTKVIE